MSTRPSYRQGVAWIASNDETAETDPVVMADVLSVLLLADLFGKRPIEVAEAVVKQRAT